MNTIWIYRMIVLFKVIVLVVKIIYDKPKKLLGESRTISLFLRRFVPLPKIVQADYQPRSLQDKTV